MIRLDIDMPLGCIYEKNGKTEYCPLCNHYDVPFCQVIDDEAEIGIDERPCYCPLSAEPERKTGRWIEDSGNIACSICHAIWLHRRTSYCPNCGAEMREER